MVLCAHRIYLMSAISYNFLNIICKIIWLLYNNMCMAYHIMFSIDDSGGRAGFNGVKQTGTTSFSL